MHTGISTDTTTKSLRVGVNGAMVDSRALATLLIDKGIITEVEYFTALAVAAEQELQGYCDKHKMKFI